MSTPKLSIVLAAYNSEKYIKECIDSVLDQNYHDYELIIVDDESTDSTPSILSEYVKKYDRIKVITQLNGGRSEARNKGISEAKGKYIWVIDHDDMISKNCIGPIVNISHNLNLDIFAVAPPRKFKKEIMAQNLNELRGMVTPVISGKTLLIEGASYWAPWEFVINREFYNRHNFKFRQRYFLEDVELMYRVFYHAQRFAAWRDFSCYSYIPRPESETKSPWTRNKILDYARYINLVEDFIKTNVTEEDIKRVFELKRTQFYLNGINNWKTVRDKMKLEEYLGCINTIPSLTYGSYVDRLYQLISFHAPKLFAKLK